MCFDQEMRFLQRIRLRRLPPDLRGLPTNCLRKLFNRQPDVRIGLLGMQRLKRFTNISSSAFNKDQFLRL